MSRETDLVAGGAECYCFDVLSRWVSVSFAVALLASCEDEPQVETWQIVHEDLPGALLSVWGTAQNDVWSVGADARDGTGPTVVHFDGDSWTRVTTSEAQGDLWWVFGFDGGPIYMGGDGGVILRYQTEDGVNAFERMTTPGTSTVYGIWGASPDDVWAVGGDSDASGGFAWRLVDDVWTPEPSVPAEVPMTAAIWKAYGSSTNDVWLVGSSGVALHWDGTALTQGDTGVGSSLFTVFEKDGVYAAVGGLATGLIVEAEEGVWRNVTPEPPPMGLAGVTLGDAGSGIAVGMMGTIYTRDDSGWTLVDPGLKVRQNLHGSWIDEKGGLWAVGGQTLTPPLTEGVMLHRGTTLPSGGL